MKHGVISALCAKELSPGVKLRSAYLEKVMVTFVEFEEGALVPLHSHEHEQISVVISGCLLFNVDNEEKLVRAGEVVLVPSGAKHSAAAVAGPAVAYDSWSPVRADYILDKEEAAGR